MRIDLKSLSVLSLFSANPSPKSALAYPSSQTTPLSNDKSDKSSLEQSNIYGTDLSGRVNYCCPNDWRFERCPKVVFRFKWQYSVSYSYEYSALWTNKSVRTWCCWSFVIRNVIGSAGYEVWLAWFRNRIDSSSQSRKIDQNENSLGRGMVRYLFHLIWAPHSLELSFP